MGVKSGMAIIMAMHFKFSFVTGTFSMRFSHFWQFGYAFDTHDISLSNWIIASQKGLEAAKADQIADRLNGQ